MSTKNDMKLQLGLLLEVYTPRELEDTVFDVFNEAGRNPHLTGYEREKQALVHHTVRQLLRTLAENPKLLKKLQT